MKHAVAVLFMFAAMGLGVLSGCKPQRPEVSMPPDPASDPVTEAVPAGPVIATLQGLGSKVTFRRRDEHVWQDAREGLPLYEGDVVQTHAQGSANVLFENGSELDLSEKTLVILSLPEAESSKAVQSQAVLKDGNLRGRTRTELWLLTSSALFQMKPAASGETASAALAMREGERLRVELEKGTAAVLHQEKSGAVRRIALKPKEPVVLDAAPVPAGFGTAKDFVEFAARPVVESKPQAAPPAKAAPAAKKTGNPAPAADIFIASPPDNAETLEATVTLSGSATRAGIQLLINGAEVRIDPKTLQFAHPVELRPGGNTVSIQLIQSDGKSTFRRWTLIRRN